MKFIEVEYNQALKSFEKVLSGVKRPGDFVVICNETEVKIIDPNKLEVIESIGCRVREVCV